MSRESVTSHAIGLALVAFILIYPFSKPPIDLTISGFDRNLIGTKGLVDLSNSTIEIHGSPGSSPTVYLAGTKSGFIQSFSVAVIMEKALNGTPIIFRVFNVETGNEIRLVFESPRHAMRIVQISNFNMSRGRDVAVFSNLTEYRIELNFIRYQELRIALTNSTWRYEIAWSAALPLVGDEIFTSLGSYSATGESQIQVRNYALRIYNLYPSESRSSDPLLPAAVASAIVAFAVSGFPEALRRSKRLRASAIGRIRGWIGLVGSTLLNGSTIIFTAVVVLFMMMGSHHDIYSFKLWSYVSGWYGPTSTYPLTHSTTSAVHGEIPPSSFRGFVYPPLTLYLWTALGILMRSLQIQDLSNPLWDLLIKGTMVAFLLGSGCLIYMISRVDTHDVKYARTNYALFLLTPALLLNATVWGETDSIILFFGLLAALYSVKGKQELATFFILVTAFVKQTGLFITIPLLLYQLKRDGSKGVLKSFWDAIPLFFLTLAPFMLIGLQPRLLLNSYAFAPARAIFEEGTDWTVRSSKWVFNLPTIILLLLGIHGSNRFASPDSVIVPILNMSLQQTSLVFFLVGAAVLSWFMVRKRGGTSNMPLFIGLFIGMLTMIITRISPRWPALALPFLILGRKQMPTKISAFVIGAWTLTSTLSLLRSFAGVAAQFPALMPPALWRDNWFIGLIMLAFRNDILITALSLLNIIALVLATHVFGERSGMLTTGRI